MDLERAYYFCSWWNIIYAKFFFFLFYVHHYPKAGNVSDPHSLLTVPSTSIIADTDVMLALVTAGQTLNPFMGTLMPLEALYSVTGMLYSASQINS